MNTEARYLIRLAAFAVVILLLFCALSPTGFLSTANLSSMAYQMPEFAMLALAIHPTMLTGGIDLSVVSVANLSAIVAALTMRSLPPQFILVAMFIGLFIGVIGGCNQWAPGRKWASCDFGDAGNNAIVCWYRGRARLFDG